MSFSSKGVATRDTSLYILRKRCLLCRSIRLSLLLSFLFCGLLYQSCNYYVTDLICSLFFLNYSIFSLHFLKKIVLFLRLSWFWSAV